MSVDVNVIKITGNPGAMFVHKGQIEDVSAFSVGQGIPIVGKLVRVPWASLWCGM